LELRDPTCHRKVTGDQYKSKAGRRECIEVNLSAQAVRELRAQLLEASCTEFGEITGGIVEDNRPKGVFGEAKRDIQEMWTKLDDKIIEILDGEVGNRLAEIHEKVLMTPAWNSLEAMKQISGEKGAAAIEQLQENWHDFNHGMIVGEYLWVSGMITGVAGLPDTVETLGIALNERGGVAVAGDLALGIINSVKETWTEFQDGDVKDKGRVIGRLIPDAILAGMAAVKGIKSFKAARLTKTEATVTVKNGVETVEDLGEVAKVGSTVEGVVADKVDDVVRSVVKEGSGTTPRNINGQRTSRYKTLTYEEIESLKADLEALGVDPSIFRFNEGYQTGFSDKSGLIYVRGDVLPDLSSMHPRDLMSQRAVLAHEYYGHKYFGDLFGEKNPLPGAWNDEFRASYNAALNAPNLTDMDRMYLMADALERAKEAGVNIKITDTIRRILYGY